MNYVLTAIAVVVVFKLLQRWLRYRALDSEKLYRYPHNGKLYIYSEHWNVHGHRSARQDWWREVELTGRGSFKVVGPWVKDNVGYSPKTGQPWCHPYQRLSANQVRGLDQAVREERLRAA